ncbi:MAG: HupE/UreJ family protein [Exilibacterium sp.]
MIKNRFARCLHYLALLLLISIGQNLSAHETSMAYLSIDVEKPQATAKALWKIQFADITRLIDFDTDGDRQLQWREVIGRRDDILRVLNDAIAFYGGGNHSARCRPQNSTLNTEKSVQGPMLTVQFTIACANAQPVSRIQYTFLAGIDPLHTCAYQLHTHAGDSSGIFTRASPNLQLQTTTHNRAGFADYIHHGVVHILIGLDHLAFLLVLVLSATNSLTPELRNWKKIATKLAFYVTFFTFAHTLTLIASSLNIISLPTRITESIIAASVGWGAYCVIKSRAELSPWTVFGFGLLHGMGFASVLADLSPNIDANLLQLFGFNIGVELGQLVFIGAVLAAITGLSRFFSLAPVARVMAYFIFIVAVVWTFERSLSVTVIPLS